MTPKREDLLMLAAAVVLIDSALLFGYFLSQAFRKTTRKLIDLFLIKDNIGVEKTDKL